MCIIAAKPAKTPMPSRDTIRTMWNANPDGAGLMYVEKGSVRIEKGFMRYKDFAKRLDDLEHRLDLTSIPVVMHFRITTHGGTSPENTHPFPITDNVTALGKPRTTTDLGVAHNGIISSVTPRKGISDTMEYIASQLAPLKRAMPRFYENKHAMLLVKNAIGSKMAFLTKEGRIYTVGDFNEHDGIMYSNYSYMKQSFSRSLGEWNWADWEDNWTSLQGQEDDCDFLCWLNPGDYVKLADGSLFEGTDFLVDADGGVWEYDYSADCAVPMEDASAYTAAGTPKRFNEEEADIVPICPF